MSYETPYAGLKVIDLSQGVAGPYCAMLLGQYGANVIKVEPIDTGDWSRTLGTRYDDQTAYSIPANIGKRSIALDLKHQAGRDVLGLIPDIAEDVVRGNAQRNSQQDQQGERGSGPAYERLERRHETPCQGHKDPERSLR